ncbi:Uncharacterized conserved protein [Paenibacillus macerans]|nr:Uncharacterized conserved protein [Paenibacillus macerans]
MTGSYFLNDNQLATKKEILKIVSSNTVPYVAIEGRPGTGKTLLTYDIAKELIDQNWNVCLFHCGNLGQGHHDLRRSYSWNVHAIKNIEFALSSTPKYDLIIVDETQRIYSEQLERIIQYVSDNNVKCIFSYDPDQVFTSIEARRDTAGKIEKLNHKKYQPGAPNYRLDKMLYQKLTRARQEITIIIYRNESLLDACLKILEEKS